MDTTSRSAPLRRSPRRVLGGVCSGLAEKLDVPPALVRAGAVVAGMVSGGLTVLAYLLAWVLIPPAGADVGPGADAEPATDREPETVATPPVAQPPAPVDAREAWYAVGDRLQGLVGALRRPVRDTGLVADRPRSPVRAMDRVATEAGDRLRGSEVRDASRRVVESLNTAMSGGMVDLTRRRDG